MNQPATTTITLAEGSSAIVLGPEEDMELVLCTEPKSRLNTLNRDLLLAVALRLDDEAWVDEMIAWLSQHKKKGPTKIDDALTAAGFDEVDPPAAPTTH